VLTLGIERPEFSSDISYDFEVFFTHLSSFKLNTIHKRACFVFEKAGRHDGFADPSLGASSWNLGISTCLCVAKLVCIVDGCADVEAASSRLFFCMSGRRYRIVVRLRPYQVGCGSIVGWRPGAMRVAKSDG
jgi:hypothetical protein